jgi:serine/threonine protein phosphatase PrpC
MGGAQAGEVASEIAVKQFEGGLPDGQEPGEALARHAGKYHRLA